MVFGTKPAESKAIQMETKDGQESEKDRDVQKKSPFDLIFNQIQRKKSNKGKSDFFQVNRFFRGFERNVAKPEKENAPQETDGAQATDPTPDNVDGNSSTEKTEFESEESAWWKVEQLMQKFGKRAERNYITLNNCELTAADMKELSVLLCCLSDVEELDISWNDLIGGSVHLLTSQFSHISNLKILALSNCSLTVNDFVALGEALKLVPHLEGLDLSWNTHLGGNLTSVTQHFSSQCNIKSLNLTECNLKSQDIDALAQALSKMPKLESLDLSANKEIGAVIMKITEELMLCSYLRELKLHAAGLKQDGIKNLSSAFEHWPCLRQLDLSGNKEAGGGFREAAARLTSFKQLELLDIHKCCLSADDIAALTQVIPLLSNLQVLNISSNKSVGQSPEHLFSRLRFLPKLKSVIASNCALRTESIVALAEASNYLLDLEILDLSWNKCVGGNLKLFSKTLKNTAALHSLMLSSCNLVTQDMAVLASAVQDGHLQDLQLLDLAYNDTISDEGWGLFFESLGDLKNIAELDISLRPSSSRHCGPWFIHLLSSFLKLPKLKDLGMQRWVLSDAEQQQLDRVSKERTININFD
ncbi:leucine-rich repeat-containing protein 31 isoform X2 [Spea bombifrons]|uniref:leucine-rich repeat-containing protein 31 isoform X2 n=1 Tax=Spea bombifrons TaxID=233779 RepID=UPI00234AACB4|nr:leucine-rich repeat-containing protein 31 isoform X2 [Spea bombifrons]